MNFTFTWIMDKLGYMPKINMEVGKISDDLWSFPIPTTVKKKPAVAKATIQKAKKTPAKKAPVKKAK